jgi:hypothetical protein
MPALQTPAGGQPNDAAAQSGGSSGTGADELQGPPATDALLSVAVICNGLRGLFHITKQVMECRCRSCQAKVCQRVCMPATEHLSGWRLQFEASCGMASEAVLQHAGARISRWTRWGQRTSLFLFSGRRSARGRW